MILEVLFAAALAGGSAGHPGAGQEAPTVEQAGDAVPSDEPTSDGNPVSFWFSTCGGPLLALEVKLDEERVFETTVPICRARRSSPQNQGRETRISFVLTPTRPIAWRGYRDEPDTSSASDPLRVDLWQAGADPDALILGVSVSGSERIYMNTLHIAVPNEIRVSEIAPGLTVSTYPAETTRRLPSASLDHEGSALDLDGSKPRTWALASDELLAWEDAVAACRDLVSGGLDDWRLPSVFELHEIASSVGVDVVDQLRSRGTRVWACNNVEIPSDEMEVHWQYDFEWGFATRFGRIGAEAFCVRGPSDCEPSKVGPAICFFVISFQTGEPIAGLPFKAVLKDGGTRELGVSTEAGSFCVDRSTAERQYAYILGCHRDLCLGVENDVFDRAHEKVLRFDAPRELR